VWYHVKDDFDGTLQRPISVLRHRETPYGASLRPMLSVHHEQHQTS